MSLDDPRNKRRAWRIFAALLHLRTARFPVLSIAVAMGITTSALAELMADNYAPPSQQPLQRVQLPELPIGNRPELYAPRRFFPTEGILVEIRDLCNTEFTISVLSLVLDRRKRGSAPGGDGVTYQALCNLTQSQIWRLLDTFNQVWRTGVIPTAWKEALVMPIRKKGKPPSMPSSYRPVSLASSVGKTMEAMALRRLNWMADELDYFAPAQSGFRASRCTTNALADVIASLEHAKANDEVSYLLLLDVKATFDCVPHASILDALSDLGVCSRMLEYGVLL